MVTLHSLNQIEYHEPQNESQNEPQKEELEETSLN